MCHSCESWKKWGWWVKCLYRNILRYIKYIYSFKEFMYVWLLYVHHMHTGTQGDQKGASDTQELELQIPWSAVWVLGAKLGSSATEASSLNFWAISPNLVTFLRTRAYDVHVQHSLRNSSSTFPLEEGTGVGEFCYFYISISCSEVLWYAYIFYFKDKLI